MLELYISHSVSTCDSQHTNFQFMKWREEWMNEWMHACMKWMNEMEWNGMEWNGMEWNGMEWDGMGWDGMDEWMNEWMKNEWMTGLMNEWMNESTDEWTVVVKDTAWHTHWKTNPSTSWPLALNLIPVICGLLTHRIHEAYRPLLAFMFLNVSYLEAPAVWLRVDIDEFELEAHKQVAWTEPRSLHIILPETAHSHREQKATNTKCVSERKIILAAKEPFFQSARLSLDQ